MPDIHPSAVVEPGAELAPDCRVGPFCHVGPDVHLGQGVVLRSHVVIAGDTRIGDGCEVWPFASVGGVPQDMKFKGERSRLVIGPRTRIREHVTINTGTEGGGGLTQIGADCLIMAGAHIAHDACLEDRVIIVNHAAIAGHCQIGADAIIGGLSGIHQFVRVGAGAIVGALTMVTHDVIPHGLVQGPRGVLDGLNLVGLKRRGANRETIAELRAAFEALRDGEGSFVDKAAALGDGPTSDELKALVDFVTGGSDRRFLTPR